MAAPQSSHAYIPKIRSKIIVAVSDPDYMISTAVADIRHVLADKGFLDSLNDEERQIHSVSVEETHVAGRLLLTLGMSVRNQDIADETTYSTAQRILDEANHGALAAGSNLITSV